MPAYRPVACLFAYLPVAVYHCRCLPCLSAATSLRRRRRIRCRCRLSSRRCLHYHRCLLSRAGHRPTGAGCDECLLGHCLDFGPSCYAETLERVCNVPHVASNLILANNEPGCSARSTKGNASAHGDDMDGCSCHGASALAPSPPRCSDKMAQVPIPGIVENIAVLISMTTEDLGSTMPS